MLLSGVLFVLFLTLIAGAVAVAAMIARRNRRAHLRANQWPSADATHLIIIDRRRGNVRWYPYPPTDSAADAALSRHPAGRSRRPGQTRPTGPDDDPEFLRQLDQRIHGTPTDPAELSKTYCTPE